MDPIMLLGLFLLFFGVIISGSKFLLSWKTQNHLDELDDNVPSYFRNQTRWMARLIIIFILICIIWVVIL